jgi:hypothetical protein
VHQFQTESRPQTFLSEVSLLRQSSPKGPQLAHWVILDQPVVRCPEQNQLHGAGGAEVHEFPTELHGLLS